MNNKMKNFLVYAFANRNCMKLTISAAVMATSISVYAQEAEVNLSSTVIGNQEQPKVLYIVPWKPVGDSELEDQTIESQLGIVFGHVERVELRRELKYTEQLAKKAAKTSTSKK